MRIPLLYSKCRWVPFLLLWVLTTTVQAQQPAPLFTRAVGVGTTTAGQPANGIVHTSIVQKTGVDAQGNSYVTGSFERTVSFGPISLTSAGETDMFLAKLDSAGQFLWAIRAGSSGKDIGYGLVVASTGETYVTGYFRNSLTFGGVTLTGSAVTQGFVAKFNSQGTCQWAVLCEGAGSFGNALALDYAGNILLQGTFGASVRLGATTLLTSGEPLAYGDNAFVAKLDPAGNWLWAVRGGHRGGDIAVDGFGYVYVVGAFGGSSAFGATTLTSLGSQEVYVAKLDPAGTWLWAQRGGGTSYDFGASIGVDYAGNVFIAGGFNPPSATFGSTTLINRGAGNYDAFVAKLDASGNYLWAVGAGGTDNDLALSLAVDDDGSVYALGEYQDYGPGATFGSIVMPNLGRRYGQLFVAKLTSAGSWEWVTTTQGPGDDAPRHMALDHIGGIYVAGSFTGATVSFGATTLVRNPGTNTGFLARLGGSPLATVARVLPAQGAPGTRVTIQGARFSGATAVLFNGVPTPSFTVTSPSTIEATVPAGASTGPVSVSTPAGPGLGGSVFQVGVLATTTSASPLAVVYWPNPVPAGTSLSLSLPPATSSSQPTEVTLYTLHGQVVVRRHFTAAKAALMLENVPPGLYMLHVRTAQQEQARYAVLVK